MVRARRQGARARGSGAPAREVRQAIDDRGERTTASGFWQVLAVVGLIAATAGWTTAAVIALRPSSTPAAGRGGFVAPGRIPSPRTTPSLEPPVESHAVAELEAMLPADVNGTSLTRESWTGDTILGDDSWSTSITTFLTGAGKTAADLQASQAYDAHRHLDLSAGAFRASGIGGAALRDAIIAAYKGDYPDLKLTTDDDRRPRVTNGDFGDGSVNSYWYIRDDVVFDIETSDASIAQAALAALPAPGASGASATPSASAPPAASRRPGHPPSPS